MRGLIWSLIAVGVGALVAGPASGQTRVGLLQMKVEGGADPVIGAQLTNRLAEVLAARPGFTVIAPDDIRTLLEREATLQMLGCEDDSCLAELGGALGADLLVNGRVTKLSGRYVVALSAVDPVRAESVGRASQTWGGESIALLDLIGSMVDLLLPPPGAVLEGTLELSGARAGSQILLDDEVRGTAPAGQMGRVPVGAHELRVIAEGQQPWSKWIVVHRGRTTTVPVDQAPLASKPFYSTWWFWTVAGVAVAGAATGVAVAMTQGGEPAGATGVNVAVNADSAFGGGR